jgi:putative tricarboxylic transport membrane protein
MLVLGIVIGLLIGVLPGLTLVMGVALALPFTYGMDVTASIVLLTAMYVSGTYGGAFTAILFRIPGEPIDVPMLWDGYTMARRGQPAKALGWTLVAAFIGGIVSAIIMVALTQPLATFALRFYSPEYFAILLFGLTSVVALGTRSLPNALISLSVGLLIGTVGTDPIYGSHRLTFGSALLADGIEFLVVMVGAYGIGEVLSRLDTGFAGKQIGSVGRTRTELPGLREMLEHKGVFARSSLLGNVTGLAPPSPRSSAMVWRPRSGGEGRRWEAASRKAWLHPKRPRRPRWAVRWCPCSRSASRVAGRLRSSSAPSCCTASSPARMC